MRKYGYPQSDFHKMQHDQFIREVNSQIKKLANPSQDDGLQLYSYLLKWIVNHIAKSDKVWADFVTSKLQGK